ncbi:MAG: tetratricopeptide repeat protein [Candidatus Aminicenantales bacterium]
MSRKTVNLSFMILLAASVVFFAASCKKLSVNRLKANYHFNKANSLFGDNKYRDAIKEYEAALKYNPELSEAYRYLGESYKNLYKPGVETPDNMEKAEKALEALNKAYEIDPENKEIIHSLGNMYDLMRNFEEAERYFLKILDMEPTNMNNYYVVAGFYKRYSGENEELKAKAEQMYLRRIELDPENPKGYAYIAQYYNEMLPIPEFDKAYEFYQHQTKLEPDNALIYYAIGVNRFFKAFRLQKMLALEERKKLAAESEAALKKSIDLDPTYSFSYAYMNILYRNVFTNVYPERKGRYIAEADAWQERFQDVRKREVERQRLEQELKKGEIK